jgi:hypothetical protein
LHQMHQPQSDFPLLILSHAYRRAKPPPIKKQLTLNF